jgi:outer membrane protein OmpA-like peptidoglycan-associated protein
MADLTHVSDNTTITTSAGSAGSTTSTMSTTRIVQRRWIRHERPIWPFVWRGLLPILGLLLLAWYAFWPFARGDVEATVLQETRSQLASQGFGWANVAVSGQNVTLSGTQPKPGDGEAALTVARAANCPSWAGRLTCAVMVNGQFTEPASAPVAAAVPSPVLTPAAPLAVAAQACEKSLADVVAKSKIVFATSSATIKPSSAPVLDALAEAARGCPGEIRIEGHTDSRGLPASNKELSMARATSVRAALVERGIPAQQLQAQGFGQDVPVADNGSEAGRTQNRRIEFRVVTNNRN